MRVRSGTYSGSAGLTEAAVIFFRTTLRTRTARGTTQIKKRRAAEATALCAIAAQVRRCRRSRSFEEPRVRQLRKGFLFAVLVSAIAVCGQQPTSGASSPADILYAHP